MNRFQFMRQMYTCMFEVSQWGGTCFDPAFYYYPLDDQTFDHINESFMVSGSLLVTPILEPNVRDTFSTYFPSGRWVSLADLSQVVIGGKNVTLKDQSTVHVHLRPGTLTAFQNNSDSSVTITDQLINKPIAIIANRDQNGKAAGTLLLDTGLSRKEIDNN